MRYTEEWLVKVIQEGGDTVPPPSPDDLESCSPCHGRQLSVSLTNGNDSTVTSPKRKYPESFRDYGRSCEASPSKRRRQILVKIESPNMAHRSPAKKSKGFQVIDDDGPDAVRLNTTLRPARRDPRAPIRGAADASALVTPMSSRIASSGASTGDATDVNDEDSSINESASSKVSRRSRSPTKRMVDLKIAEKKIIEKGVTSNSDLPPDAESLYLDIQTIGMTGCGIVPLEMKDDVAEACKGIERFLPFMVTTQASVLSQEQLAEELKELTRIRNGSSFCRSKEVHEPSWNERVHSRILQQAVVCTPGVEYHNITTARVLKELVPDNHYGEILKKKMVDYAITVGSPIIPESDVSARLGSSVGALRRTINACDYSPLCYDPVAISVETKTPNGLEQEAKVQLSVWALAHFNRLRCLLPKAFAQQPVSISLPLLFASGESWTLLLASDRHDRIEIIGSVLIGSTASILGCYKVLTAMRRLCDWATTKFKDWFVKNILTQE